MLSCSLLWFQQLDTAHGTCPGNMIQRIKTGFLLQAALM